MTGFGIALILGAAAGIIALATRSKAVDEEQVYKDYDVIQAAAWAYREENGHFARQLSLLSPFFPEAEKPVLKPYGLSLDGKFLTVPGLEGTAAERVMQKIGGDSYINGGVVYAALHRHQLFETTEPVAHFDIIPDSGYTTTTVLEYDDSGCVADGGEIVERKWDNKQKMFTKPGIYTIRLRVQDNHQQWSKPFEREIKVVEKPGVREIVTYDNSFFFLYNNGKLVLRGNNEFGQLGTGSISEVVQLSYSSLHDGIVEVACGSGFNVFRFSDGSVGAAGTNRHGELGLGDRNSQKSIASVWGLSNIIQIAAGDHFAAALDASGKVFVWGDNGAGQLGIEDVDDSLHPMMLEGVSDVKSIALGSNFGLALKRDGHVIGWGDNSFAQLGIGDKGGRVRPVVTGYTDVEALYAGDRFSLAVTTSGTVCGAGNNAYGQLGIRGSREYIEPKRIPNLQGVRGLEVRESLVLAVLESQHVMVWGNFNAPGTKPVLEPLLLEGMEDIQWTANNGKKLFLMDGAHTLYVVTDLMGNPYTKPMYGEFSEFVSAFQRGET